MLRITSLTNFTTRTLSHTPEENAAQKQMKCLVLIAKAVWMVHNYFRKFTLSAWPIHGETLPKFFNAFGDAVLYSAIHHQCYCLYESECVCACVCVMKLGV